MGSSLDIYIKGGIGISRPLPTAAGSQAEIINALACADFDPDCDKATGEEKALAERYEKVRSDFYDTDAWDEMGGSTGDVLEEMVGALGLLDRVEIEYAGVFKTNDMAYLLTCKGSMMHDGGYGPIDIRALAESANDEDMPDVNDNHESFAEGLERIGFLDIEPTVLIWASHG